MEDREDAKPEANRGNQYLQELLSAASPEILENGVQAGLKVLQSLKGPLEAAAPLNTTQATQWLKSINELETSARPTRTIVGVVGNTGAGKSSVISAVLDEERLLPTNCMRACTASPTEISFNYSENPDELYRADVEFITSDEWIKELQGLYTDLLDGNGEVSRECTNQDSEAGIAYAKIKAVYPKKTKEMISQSNPMGLANEPAVRKVLGSTKNLKATTAASIYRQLQTYVDSKEKNTDKSMEYWPLIKVVRIYTKASALSTGACLVDLPGVQDSNAARAAVAAKYMKECTGLWIVAPITRAVDDKTAKSLLGDTFRRQLKYDGSYSAVTFICSKTDDISVTEAAESLEIEDEIHDSWTRVQELEENNRNIRSQISDLRAERDNCDDRIDEVEQEWEKWDALASKISDGETVYAPSDKPTKKRKRSTKPSGSRKRHSGDLFIDDDDDDDDFLDDVESISDSSDKENSQPDENRQPLTQEDIDNKLDALRTQKKEIRQTKREIDQTMAGLRKDIEANKTEMAALNHEVKSVCIKGRNEYSRKAIKHDFAMGIKELDQETAAEADEANFDPEVDVRDYDAVAESLPVFCVSSRAFQKLSGRLQKDNFNAAGFAHADDTEVPQLQAHAKKLTEAGRAANCRRFLNDLGSLLNSMTMWATDDGTRSNFSDAEKRAEEQRIRGLLVKIEQDLDKAVDETFTAIGDALAENVYEKFDLFIPKAIEAALPTATHWGAHKSEGGMLWATYKATCRRNGVFSGASGPRDCNAELFDPISVNLVSGWERVFQRRFPSILDKFAISAKLVLETFHRQATQRTNERGGNYQGVMMLNQQLQTHNQSLSEVPNLLIQVVRELQRDANRSFTPVILEKMIPAYEACVEERGPGSFARMKEAMLSHVTRARSSMFRDATNAVRTQLSEMCRQMKRELEDRVSNLHARLSQDYLSVLVGADARAIAQMPRAERLLRSEMAPLLARADAVFAPLIGHEVPMAIRERHGEGENDDDDAFGDEGERVDIRNSGHRFVDLTCY
ncbi:nuclear GTPase SLIP-GC [Naviculisporaceae sp. PSN 640]